MIPFLALCALSDLALLLAPVPQSVASLWFAPGHLILTLAALAACLIRSPRSKVRALILPIGAAFGPCGMLLFGLLAPYLSKFRRRRQLTYRVIRTRRFHNARDITPIERLARILDERVRYPEPDQVGSLAGMLRYGTLQSRYKALETVVTSFEPTLSPLIVIALSDEDQTIRALAAAAAAQISSNLAQQRRELEAKIAPNHNLDDRYSLAMLLADHGCYNQLLPQAQRARLCHEAAGQIQDIIKMLPANDMRQGPLRAIRSQLNLEIGHQDDAARRPIRSQPLEVAS